MNTPTLITLILVLAVLGAIVFRFVDKKKKGQSITGCDSCNKDCPHRM